MLEERPADDEVAKIVALPCVATIPGEGVVAQAPGDEVAFLSASVGPQSASILTANADVTNVTRSSNRITAQ